MPLPMMVPTTTAVAWLTPRSRASFAAARDTVFLAASSGMEFFRLLGDECACQIPGGERNGGADADVPRPGDGGTQPDVKFGRESENHADHGAALVRPTSEQA